MSIPACFILVNALSKLLGIYNLPVFSLPFCIITIALLYFFTLRISTGKLQLTPFQHYSPEKNLYLYSNNLKRLHHLKYLRLSLPFMGAWTVSQGYDANITHKDEWAQALDFVIEDEEQKTFEYPGTRPEHFYCYNKPVLACADGVVETIADNIEDNAIGQTNPQQNWGNTVVIKHAVDLYSKVSHLKKNSIKVKPGDVVKQGDLLALCGNSGRSPEPHLHFQVQLTPYIGSKTLAYPFADYAGHCHEDRDNYFAYSIPQERMVVSPVDINTTLKQAFAFEPGYYGLIKNHDGKQETWEVFIDGYSGQYLYSQETGAAAYFINNGHEFYFTAFYGDEKSLLYYFYMAAYHINFNSNYPGISADVYPLPVNKPALWLHDFVAPFYRFIKHTYQNQYEINGDEIIIRASKQRWLFNKCIAATAEASITISTNRLTKLNNKIIEATWDTANS
jgi:murein DD-endopeptidase MepM/ murein hydrolase activator NlpD